MSCGVNDVYYEYSRLTTRPMNMFWVKLELVKDCLLPSLNEKWLLSDMYSEKVTFVQTYQLGLSMEKEEKIDQKPGIVIIFENLVGIGALLICID